MTRALEMECMKLVLNHKALDGETNLWYEISVFVSLNPSLIDDTLESDIIRRISIDFENNSAPDIFEGFYLID